MPGSYAGQNSSAADVRQESSSSIHWRDFSCSVENETSDSPRLQHPCGIPEEPGPQSPRLAVQIFLQNHGYTFHPENLEKGQADSRWKPGKDPSLAANYRPISLLSVCYKLLERLALQRISPTVEGLLSPDQAGFQKRSKHLWPGWCRHHFHRNWIPAEPEDWRCKMYLRIDVYW